MNDYLGPDSDSDSTSTVFRDIIFLALAGFVAVVIMLLPHVNPPKQLDEQDIPPPGNMMVEMFWEDEYDIDVDLWVKAPKDKVVGFSTKSGQLFDLLRDDLGHTSDITNRNYEIALTRGVIAGEYIVNVMLYNIKTSSEALPIEVLVVVSMKKKRKSKLVKLLKTTITLYENEEEVTAFSFKLDQNLNLINDSVSKIYRPLAKKRNLTTRPAPPVEYP